MTRPTQLERFWSKVDKSGDCWLWIARIDRYGYGKFNVGRRDLIAHRWGYEALVGPIPDGLTLDHLCHTSVAAECAAQLGPCLHRRCVNPDHLEPVTSEVNWQRGNSAARAHPTECTQGHAYTPDNTWIDMRGTQLCRICRRKRGAEWARKNRQRKRATQSS